MSIISGRFFGGKNATAATYLPFIGLFQIIFALLIFSASYTQDPKYLSDREVAEEIWDPLGGNERLSKVSAAFFPIHSKLPGGTLLLISSEPRFRDTSYLEMLSERCSKANWDFGVVAIESQEGEFGRKEDLDSGEWLSHLVYRWIRRVSIETKRDIEESEEAVENRRTQPPLFVMLSGEAVNILSHEVIAGRQDVEGWVTSGGARFPDVTMVAEEYGQESRRTLAPGMIIGGRDGNRDAWDFFQSLRTSNLQNRASFLPFQSIVLTNEMYDQMAIVFLKALRKGEEETNSGMWMDYDSMEYLTEAVLENSNDTVLARYAWFPSESVAGAWKVLAMSRPSEPPFVVKMFSNRLKRTLAAFSRVEFHHNKLGKEPKGIFLIVLDSERPQSIFQSEEWVKFARDEGLALMVLNVKNGKRIRSHNQATEWLGERFFAYLEKGPYKEFSNIPIIWHGRGKASYWMQRIMMKRPERFVAWSSHGATEFADVPPKQVMPTGLIISARNEQNFPSLFFLQDIRKANKGNRVCMLAHGDNLLSPRYIEEFVRDFLSEATTKRQGNGFWLRYKDGKRLTFSESQKGVDPADYVWFPSRAVAGKWDLISRVRPQIPFPTVKKFTIKTRLEEQPELNLFIRIPGRKKGGQIESVDGVLCFCTWQKEDTSLLNRLKRPDDPLVSFADRNNLAVITWNTAGLLPPGTSIFSLSEVEEMALAKKFDQIGEVWLKGIEKVCRDNKLPRSGFLLHGVSRGSTYAHRLALRHPDKFLAVHTHIANHYEKPTKDASNLIWLVTTGEIDVGYRASREFFLEANMLGFPTLVKAGPSLGHAMRDDIEKLSLSFFEFALRLRDLASSKRESPQEEGDEKVTAADLFRERLSNAPYFGDFINHEVYSKADGEWVPEGQRISLPTEALANAWGEPPENIKQ